MAILKAIPRLQRMPTQMTEIARLHRTAREPLRMYDAHVDAYRKHQIDAFMLDGGKVEQLPTVGRPLECQKWYQRDYRSATPKGLVLKSAIVRGERKRFAVS